MENIFIGLGSNIGDRHKNLIQAKSAIDTQIGKIIKESKIYETDPVGILDQPMFLNQVIEISTELTPETTLNKLLEIELEMGRTREIKWGPRNIDLDLLYYNNEIRNLPNLTLPHPRLHERQFVLEPLNEISPNFTHPILKKTSAQLFSELEVSN